MTEQRRIGESTRCCRFRTRKWGG